jgi:hypothetical protein
MQFWIDWTFWDKLAFWPKFAMITQESLNTKSSLTYSVFCWLLIHLHPIHGSTIMSFQSGLWCWIDSGQIDNWSKTLGLGHKMTEGQWGLNTDFTANSLNFSSLTHTHELSNHSNGYDHPKIEITRSFSEVTILLVMWLTNLITYQQQINSVFSNQHVIPDFYAKTKYSSYAWFRINCFTHTAKSVHR